MLNGVKARFGRHNGSGIAVHVGGNLFLVAMRFVGPGVHLLLSESGYGHVIVLTHYATRGGDFHPIGAIFDLLTDLLAHIVRTGLDDGASHRPFGIGRVIVVIAMPSSGAKVMRRHKNAGAGVEPGVDFVTNVHQRVVTPFRGRSNRGEAVLHGALRLAQLGERGFRRADGQLIRFSPPIQRQMRMQFE